MVKSNLFFFIFFIAIQVHAQHDTTIVVNETHQNQILADSIFKFNTKNPSAKRAGLYSAIVPGLGQIYNKQYWKLGVVVVGIGTAAYFIRDNYITYQKFRTAYIARIDNNINTNDEFINVYSTSDLEKLQSDFRKYLEYSVIGTTAGYALNILDAFISAHLKTFDIDENISFKVQPSYQQNQLGFAVKLKF